MMTGDGLLELRRRTTLVRGINPRGARHWGAASRHQTCIRQVRLDPNHRRPPHSISLLEGDGFEPSGTAAQKPWIYAAFRAFGGIGGALKRYHLSGGGRWI